MGRAGAGFDPLFIAPRLGARRRASEGARGRGGRRRDAHPEVYSPAPIINALIIFASCVVNAVRDDVCYDASHRGRGELATLVQPANCQERRR